jgi:hypothetical protein
MPDDRMQERDSRPMWHGPATVVGVSIGVLLLLLATDAAGGLNVRLGGAMLALPALVAVFASPGTVVIVAGAMLPAYAGSLALNGRLTWEDAPVSLVTAVVICVAAVVASRVRVRRERELEQSRRVTAKTQQIMQRPLPSRLGPLEISSVYLASDQESTIGGDLYASAIVDGRARVIVGDVQGKGLSAVEVVMYLITAFRRASRQHVALADLPLYLDDAVRGDLLQARDEARDSGADDTESAMERQIRECFVTAVVIETAQDGGHVRVANCGHPPPVLLHDGTAEELLPSTPALPLGLLRLDPAPVHIDTIPLAPDDTLLLYTDGLIEARDEAGAYYPMTDRVGKWSAYSPEAMLDAIQSDLRRYAHAHLVDDVAMVTMRRAEP